MIRLVERLRRCIADQYDVPLSSLMPDSAFVSRISAAPAIEKSVQEARDDYGQMHSDECSIQCHYSAVLYLSTQGSEFSGGDFVFCDGTSAGGLRETRLSPKNGQGIYFSSGWENLHYVDAVQSGTRFAVPVFFTTAANPITADGGPVFANAAAAANALCSHVVAAKSLEDAGPLGYLWHSLFAREDTAHR